jgi:hypothetical protein
VFLMHEGKIDERLGALRIQPARGKKNLFGNKPFF